MNDHVKINTERMLADLRTLREFGAVGSGVHRLAFSEEDQAARAWLCQRLSEAGLEASIDGAGNVFGKWPTASTAVLTGSHIDTVPMGGWLDGAYGVVAALEVARAAMEQTPDRDVGIDVVCFADEEGTFRGTLGSTVFCGIEDLSQLLELPGAGEGTLGEAISAAGYGGDVQQLDSQRTLAFIELHIEQGPTLEARGVDIGVVTGIVGMRKYSVSYFGRTDHAGTTPMHMRLDAGAAVVQFVSEFTQRVRDLADENTVWNLGSMSLNPGASNVVTAKGQATIEFRDVDEQRLKQLDSELYNLSNQIAASSGCSVEIERSVFAPPTTMAVEVVEMVERAATAAGTAMRLPSGAGHDAMNLARFVPTGMVFVPSIEGKSHDVEENTSDEDLSLGATVLAAAIDMVAR